MLRTLLLGLLLTLQAHALPGWKLDGVEAGETANQIDWPHQPQKDGQFRHGATLVKVEQGVVVSVSGSSLTTPAGATIKKGQSGDAALKTLGTAESVLYGCGKDSQQIHFFKRYQLDLTVTNGKVTSIRLFSETPKR